MESVLAWREFYVPVCLDMNILRLMDFKCVSYESICGIGYRVFAASGKYFMGKGKSVCDYYNPFPYCFKSNSAIIIALPDLFYRRGIFAACVMNMGILGIVFFLVSWLPHGILYLAALALLLLVEPHRFYNRKNPWLLRLAWGMGVAVLVLLGCVLEASVGIRLLRFVVEKL